MTDRRTLWFDITNSSHVHFFRPVIENFKSEFDILITTRNLAETNQLLDRLGYTYKTVGGYWGQLKFLKILRLGIRALSLIPHVRSYDFSFSHGPVSPIFIKYISKGKLISSYDNENADSFDLLAKHSDHFIVPEILLKEARSKAGKNTTIHTYPGVKEQIYLADFEPNEKEIQAIPFKNYLVLRPEAWKSHYIGKDEILTFDLAKELVKEGYNIVLLPRYGTLPNWIKNEKKIYTPEKTINGPQLCWFSQGVLTGSGTFAREAGVLGIPSISFYPGKPLKVDLWMNKKGYIHRSRNIEDILKHLKNSKKKLGLLNEAKVVREDFLKSLKDILNS